METSNGLHLPDNQPSQISSAPPLRKVVAATALAFSSSRYDRLVKQQLSEPIQATDAIETLASSSSSHSLQPVRPSSNNSHSDRRG